MSSEHVALSVIVATLDNSKNLFRLLESLDAQYMPYDEYEVVVVDAHSTDDTDARMKDAFFHYRMNYFVSRKPGILAARNHGAEEAQGDHLLFLSDDLLAPPSLLQAHHEAHKEFPHQVVRGPVVPLETEAMPMLDEPPPSVRLFFTIVNSSMSKMAIHKIGGFAEDTEAVLEDREIGWRLQQEAWAERFHPAAFAYRPAAKGRSLTDLKEQAMLLARTAVTHYMKHPDPSVAYATGIHPMMRAMARITSGNLVYSVARALHEGKLGEHPRVRGALEQRIFMNYYYRALKRELAEQEL